MPSPCGFDISRLSIMVEVVRNNFEDLFPEIKQAIENSTFVAIDTEFTGLHTSDSAQPSLFDDSETRYKKLRKTASQFLISQFGLTAFVQSKDESNEYVAHTYNFFLYPQSFGPIDCRFLSQASSLEFLCQHNFDFNKFIYSGVPFLNKEQEATVRQYHENSDLYLSLQSQTLRIIDEKVIAALCVQLEEWLSSASDGDSIELNPRSCQAQYLLLEEARSRFTGIRCSVKHQFKVVVTKTASTSQLDQKSEADALAQEQDKILNTIVGFSRVFQVLAECKKPLIGHNLLTDILLMYEKFHKPLPESLKKFKSEINCLFPKIYDTKLIAFEIRRTEALSQCSFFDDTNLEELYAVLESNNARFYALFQPSIPFAEKCYRYVDTKMPHEAGYDSFLSGFVFLRMAHILAFKSSRTRVEGPLPFSKLIRVVKPFENLIQLSRARVSHVNLAGPDPPTIRPQWLHVTCKDKTKPLFMKTLAQEFSQFGSVDVKILDSHHALVAVARHRRAKDVLRTFRRHETLRVRTYNALLDSSKMKAALWCSGAVLVASTLAIVLWKTWR